MKIEHVDDGRKGAFYVREDNHLLAEMTYLWSGDRRIIIDHTEVDSAFKGRGVGQQLLAEVIAFAREQKIRIMPLCPFAKAQLDKNPAYSDVLF